MASRGWVTVYQPPGDRLDKSSLLIWALWRVVAQGSEEIPAMKIKYVKEESSIRFTSPYGGAVGDDTQKRCRSRDYQQETAGGGDGTIQSERAATHQS
jgi:hypothetical protein